jgi:cysteine desulfurase
MDYIYLDNGASTMVDPKVVMAMEPYLLKDYGKPSSDFGHSYGVNARRGVENARAVIAKKINAEPEEVIFTSGMAEGNNLAMQGAISMKKGGIITSSIEQNTILNVVRRLGRECSVKIIELKVDGEGFVDLEGLRKAIMKDTRIVSIQHANQEIGTVQDTGKIGKICREGGVLFHTDASHSFLKTPIDVKKMNVDLMTLTAHLIHGPRGVGALYIRKGVEIDPIMFGGGEERGLRPGTEDVPGIAGFGRAVEIYDEKDNGRMRALRDRLIDGLLKIKNTHLNGPTGDRRLCNNADITFKYVEGESLLLHLDMRGIAVTTGSACFSPDLAPSHVIIALGLGHADAHGSVRFSLSKYNTKDEMDYTIKNVKEVVEKLREISSLGGE